MEFIGPELPLFPITSTNASEAISRFFPTASELTGMETAKLAVLRIEDASEEERFIINATNPNLYDTIDFTSKDFEATLGKELAASAVLGMLAMHYAAELQERNSSKRVPTISKNHYNEYIKSKNQGITPALDELVNQFMNSEPYLNNTVKNIEIKTEYYAAIILGLTTMKDILQFNPNQIRE